MAEKTANTRHTTRASKEKVKTWAPPANLDIPSPPPGVHYRWVRFELVGTDQATNVYSRSRQGYEPVRPEELTENFEVEQLKGGKLDGVIRSGDLILMKVDAEIAEQRRQYFKNKTQQMQDAVDFELERHQNPQMPITKENTTTVSGASPGAKFQEDPE